MTFIISELNNQIWISKRYIKEKEKYIKEKEDEWKNK